MSDHPEGHPDRRRAPLTRVVAPATLSALDQLRAGSAELNSKQASRRTAVEIGKAFEELLAFERIDLTPEQRATAERGALAYLTWWCQERGIETPAELAEKAASKATQARR